MGVSHWLPAAGDRGPSDPTATTRHTLCNSQAARLSGGGGGDAYRMPEASNRVPTFIIVHVITTRHFHDNVASHSTPAHLADAVPPVLVKGAPSISITQTRAAI